MTFNFSGIIKPTISAIAERAGYGTQALQRAANNLEVNGMLTKTRNRNPNGTLGTNTYDLSGFYEKIAQEVPTSNQMALFDIDSGEYDTDSEDFPNRLSIVQRFGKFGEKILENGFAFSPRALDEYQKELKIDVYESIFIKYCLLYSNDSAVCEISLNRMREELPISKGKTTQILKDLSKSGLILIQEQTSYGRKKANRYDLSPLLTALEKLEKKRYVEMSAKRKK